VHEQLAQRDRLTPESRREAEVVTARELLGEGDLLAPRRHAPPESRVSDRPVEVGVGSASV